MIRFYYGSGSPFAWRVQLALEEKKLAYEPVLLSFQAGDLKKPDYLRISPHGKVPALVDDGLALYESQAIVEYLEERYPERPLLPRDPAGRARVRIEELECVLYIF
jgi:glutathione S-transferase